MTIDGLIEKLKSDSIMDGYNFQGYSKKQKQQIAGWLEELKEARKGFNENRKAGYAHGYSDGYAKALDEFAERLKDFIAKNVEDAESSNDLCCEIYQSEVDEIAEELRCKE